QRGESEEDRHHHRGRRLDHVAPPHLLLERLVARLQFVHRDGARRRAFAAPLLPHRVPVHVHSSTKRFSKALRRRVLRTATPFGLSPRASAICSRGSPSRSISSTARGTGSRLARNSSSTSIGPAACPLHPRSGTESSGTCSLRGLRTWLSAVLSATRY